MRHPVRATVFGALAVGVLASGCSQVTNTPGTNTPSSAPAPAFIVDYKGDTPTPAPEVPGAKTGGTITILSESDFEHLDPQQIYVSNALGHGQDLFHRSLTYYIEDAKGGPLKLVGDLATNAGETTDNGKTWKYTLRDGIKFDDGTPITSADVAYGLARSFGPQGVQGPQYLQSILSPDHSYKGPSSGPLPPGITTPDAKTIIFTLPAAHPELPYLVSFPISTPVPQAKDTKEKYDTEWVSEGPYRRKEYQKDVKLVLEKNPNWDPKSDPIRHQYVDQFVFEFGVDADAQTNRLKAASGGDASAVMDANVSPNLIADIKADASVMQRVTASASPFVTYLYINTQRVTDPDVRKALNFAHNRDAYIKAVGGYDVAKPATTILAPIVPGYKAFDAYKASNGGNEGDVDKAKALLQGKTVPKLKYCIANTPVNQTVTATVQAGLKRAGFDFVTNPIDPANYYTTVGKKNTDCDLMQGGWGQDFPDGESTLGVLMDGSKIVDEGNNNLAYLNDPGVNAELKRLREAPDRGAVAADYGKLDEKIMTDLAPVIPLRYLQNFTIAGPKVGNTFVSALWAHYSLSGAFVNS